MPELVFFRRGEEVLRVALERERLVLGRGEGSDVLLPDPHLSRQHVALLHDGTRCLLEDLSGQGTVVAGQPMRHGELPDGADLLLGQWRAVYREHGPTTTAVRTRTGPRTDLQSREASEAGPPPAQVRVKQGTTEFLYVPSAPTFTLGKDPGNDVVVKDRFISSHHLQVTRSEAGFRVKDLNSTNGTFLDGVRLFEAEVVVSAGARGSHPSEPDAGTSDARLVAQAGRHTRAGIGRIRLPAGPVGHSGEHHPAYPPVPCGGPLT